MARCWPANTSQTPTVWFCFRAELCCFCPSAPGLGPFPSHLVLINPLKVLEAVGCSAGCCSDGTSSHQTHSAYKQTLAVHRCQTQRSQVRFISERSSDFLNQTMVPPSSLMKAYKLTEMFKMNGEGLVFDLTHTDPVTYKLAVLGTKYRLMS